MYPGQPFWHGAGRTGEQHVERIPETLGDAIEAYRDNSFIREILGEHIYVKYLEAKEEEWRDLRAQVTDWEVNQYLWFG